MMNLEEDIQTELKESGEKIPENLYEPYSSFANTDGGTIYLGIKEGHKNTISGVSNLIELKILSYLTNKEEGATTAEISSIIQMKTTMTNQILSELISIGKLVTNNKKTRGKRFFIKK